MYDDKHDNKYTYDISVVSDVDFRELVNFLRKKGLKVDGIANVRDKTNPILIFREDIKEGL